MLPRSEQAIISFSLDNVNNFLKGCFKNLAYESIDYVSARGGYFNLPKKSYSEGTTKTAYYFYEDYQTY